MSAIDRRTLISIAGAAGAGLVLTGCGSEKHKALNGPGAGCAAGEDSLWGDSVNQPPPNYPSPLHPNEVFAAKYICGAYIRFDADQVIVNQGYCKTTTLAEEDDRIKKLMRCLKDPTLVIPNFTVLERRKNFDRLSMRYHGVLAIYVDNLSNRVRFPTVADVQNDPGAPQGTALTQYLREHIIRFSRFSGIDREEVQENKAFYQLNPVAISGDGLLGPAAYKMNYYNMDKNREGWNNVTDTVKSSHKRYSMNIHLLMAAGTGSNPPMVPIVLDPDTGNMGAQP
jgi:hypothetical protein